ncbi:MAG: hypothetical protein L0Y80_10635 [Ignavibacteriae bacterium]|nr:hypothetical protein [Ignavibacteriota bacterium]MCI0707925.1 hypothetical protein [Ignavibacteriota bacterium]
MPLIEIWKKSPDQLRDKRVQQIISFAGSGKLLDGKDASKEFRDFISQVPSEMLSRYADECLIQRFDDNGLALQDIVNQVGRRLGFEIEYGRYRGSGVEIGHDGIWKNSDNHSIVIEVKTTDTYRINLDAIADYRKELALKKKVQEEKSSILIVVGRDDTGDLEAQIRGSRHAWDIRLISVDALIRMLKLKENVEDPRIIKQISEVLLPREYTRLDGVIDIVFSTAEDVKEEELENEEEPGEETKRTTKFVTAKFTAESIERIQGKIKKPLLRRSRVVYASPNDDTVVVCLVSKEYTVSNNPAYWFGFRPHQRQILKESKSSFVAFGCGSQDSILLIPSREFDNWVDGMNITDLGEQSYWHVHIHLEESKFILHRKKGNKEIDLTKYLLKD